jgi:xylulokinase
MPELAPPGVVIGKLTTDAATACGLPAGLPVVCGLGDGQAAGLGAGITQPGLTYLNLGTAVVSGTCTATYLVDRAFRTTCSGIPGTYFLETVLLGGTYTVMWFIERCGTEFPASSFQPPTTAEEAWEQAIANLPPGADGLLLVPYWNSAMNPYWDAAASGIVVGWRGTHDRRHFYRAILEGIAFEQRLHTEGVEAATRQRVKGFVAMGGGSSSPLWCQIVADVTGKLVYRCETAEASALGAGILAAGAVGIHRGTVEAAAAMTRITPQPFEPDAGCHAIYTRLYEEVYRHLFPALQRYLDRLTELTQET